MSYTYAYTKNFIDTQYKLLNKPLTLTPSLTAVIDDNIDQGIDYGSFQKLLNKLNTIIRKNNQQTINNQQIKNQIIEQVLKLEIYKLSVINDKIYTIKNLILNSNLINNINYINRNESVSEGDIGAKLREFKQLVDELPESKYLVFDLEAEDDVDYEDNEDDDNQEEYTNQQEVEERILVQDDQPTVDQTTLSTSVSGKRFKRVLNQRVNNHMNKINNINAEENARILTEYDQLRSKLIQLYTDLNYKYEKMVYLKDLKLKLNNLLTKIKQEKPRQIEATVYDSDEEPEHIEQQEEESVGHHSIHAIQPNLVLNHPVTSEDTINESTLVSEINRFRILTEKIIYKSKNTSDIRQIISSLNNNNNNTTI